MKKFALLGVSALLFLTPAFAACGHGSAQELPAGSPALSTPVPNIPDPAPQISETPEERPTAQYIRVCVGGLNVRSGAGTSFSSLGQAEKDTLLSYDGTEGGWYKTRFLGRTAYVSAGEAYTALRSLEAGGDMVEAVIGEGMALLGTPYVYGATRFHDGKGNRLNGFTAAEFDCSSLMQYIFYRGAGALLDVTTRTQIKQGAHVEAGDLRRGDLMFFTNAARQNAAGLERVGHVALYLGENYILHTASDFAKVEQISAQRWNYFLEARRVL